MGSSREDIRAFTTDARQRAGYELYLVQRGLDPSDWKPMPGVGSGVREIRIHTTLERRVIYIAKFDEGVYVLHAFDKRSRRTAKADIDLARWRLRDVLDTRQSRRRASSRRTQ